VYSPPPRLCVKSFYDKLQLTGYYFEVINLALLFVLYHR
jgi:hypothetical protein